MVNGAVAGDAAAVTRQIPAEHFEVALRGGRAVPHNASTDVPRDGPTTSSTARRPGEPASRVKTGSAMRRHLFGERASTTSMNCDAAPR